MKNKDSCILYDYQKLNANNVYYTYDSSAHLVSMNLNGVEYYYIRNAQGDIIGLFDKSGAQVVSYTYDTWGKLISIDGSLKDSVGVKNPYRYRGYRYDTETGLYYLQSRYYNPEWGRFINADALGGKVGELLSHNVFAYCKNNPVLFKDQHGYMRELATDGGGGGGEIIAAAVTGGLGDCLKGLWYGLVGTIGAIASGDAARNFINSIESSKAETKTKTISAPLSKTPPKTQIVYRVWGQNLNNPSMPYSGPWGHSWTPVNPALIKNYRNLAGLPGGQCGAINTGRYVSVGKVLDMTGVTKRAALPLDGNIGGLEEWLFPSPQVQIQLIGVYGVNPEF